MRKALFLTRQFPPCVTSGASRAWKFASNLASIGWEPLVIAPPALKGMAAAVKSGVNPVTALYRTGEDIDVEGIDGPSRYDLLQGRACPQRNRRFPLRFPGLFRDSSEGQAWSKGAATITAQLFSEFPEIDLLYAQGPPLEPLRLALEIARNHTLAVILDITGPIDPSMPRPGSRGSSAAAMAEEQILLSGVPLLVPNRALKEYFLQKYSGRLDHGLMTIVPPAFDASHPAFRRLDNKKGETVLRIALLVGDTSRAELSAFVAGLDRWIRADGIMAGGLELSLTGEGATALLRRVAGKPLEPLLKIDDSSGIDSELEQCRNAGFFCAVLGSAPRHATVVPDRLIDALGMGIPLCIVAPEGVASKLVLDAAGAWATPLDPNSIMEMFRSMASAWSFHSLQGAPDHLKQPYTIGAVMPLVTGSIATQPLV